MRNCISSIPSSSICVRGAAGLPPRGLAVLRELTVWRDAAARLTDVPPRAFLRDEILIDLARNPVKSVEKLDRVRGLPRPVEAEYGGQIVEMTARALSLPESELPAARDYEPTPQEKFRTDSIWAVAQCLCAGQSIDVAVVTNRQEVNDLYQHLTGNPETTSPHRLLAGWRGEALGQTLSKLVREHAHIDLFWPNGSLRTTSVA